MSNIGRESVSNSLYEWQTDTLAAAAANKQLEGDDVTSFDAVTATVRLQCKSKDLSCPRLLLLR